MHFIGVYSVSAWTLISCHSIWNVGVWGLKYIPSHGSLPMAHPTNGSNAVELCDEFKNNLNPAFDLILCPTFKMCVKAKMATKGSG